MMLALYFKTEKLGLNYTVIFMTDTVIVDFNPLSANPTKWLNTLKQFVGKFPTNSLSVFDLSVKLALKGLISVGTKFHN